MFLRQEKRNRGRFCAGFTLIELLVVVLIIGILAGLALTKYQMAVAKAQYTRLIPLVKNLKDQADAYYMANGSWPASFEEMGVELPAGCSLSEDNAKIVLIPKGYVHWINQNMIGFMVYNNQHVGYAINPQNDKRSCLALPDKPDGQRLCRALTNKEGTANGDWISYPF